MNHFSRYLDAATFCRQHNLSIAAIQRTGHWRYTVMFENHLVVGVGNNPLPPLPQAGNGRTA